MALPLLASVAASALSKPNPATMPDGPINTQAGATFQGGILTVGAKQVGGTGNQAGATSATAAQTPSDSVARSVAGAPFPEWIPWAIAGGVLLLFAFFTGGKK